MYLVLYLEMELIMLLQNLIGGVAAKPTQDVTDVLSKKDKYLWEENDIKVSLIIIHLVGTRNFPKN